MDRICLILYSLYFWGCSVYAVLAPFYPPIAIKKGMTKSDIGNLFSIYAFIAFFFSPISGKIMNCMGRKNVLLVGGIIESIGMLIFGWIEHLEGPNFIAFSIVARALMGIGGSMLLVTCFAVLSNLYSDDLEKKIGIMEALGGFGLMLGPVIGGFLYEFFGYKFVFTFYTIVFLALTIGAFIILPYDNPESKNEEKIGYLKLISMKNVALVLLVVMFGMSGPSFLEPVLADFLRQNLTKNGFYIGGIFALTTFGYTAGLTILNWIPNDFNRKHILFFGVVLEGISFVSIGPWQVLGAPNYFGTCIGLIVLGFGSAWAYIPSLPYLINLTTANLLDIDKEVLNNTLSAIMGTTHYLGEAIGPVIGGYSCELFGYANGFAFFGAVILAYSLVYGVITKEFHGIASGEYFIVDDVREMKPKELREV